MSQKVLVTGVSGFIASHITLQLLEKDFEVFGSIRKMAKADKVKIGLEKHTSKTDKLSFVEIDLLDPYEKWLKVIQDVDFVIHVASPFPSRPPKTDAEIVEPAKKSVLNILKAGTEAGIKKVVLTSSTGSCMYGVNKIGFLNENNWTDTTNLKDTTAYYRSKTIAEKSAWDFIENTKNPVRFSSVLPGFVLGPILLDSFGTSVEVVKSFLNAEYPAIPNVGFPSVDVRSIADLHIKAMLSKEADGERFLGVDSYLAFKQISDTLKENYPDKKIPTRVLPDFIVRFLSIFDTSLKQILIDLGSKRQIKTDKAKKMLDWESIDMQTSIKNTAESLIAK